MSPGFKHLPAEVKLSPLGRRVFDVLARHTSFPWPVLQAQCNRAGVAPASLAPDELRRIIGHLATGVGRFTSPETEARVEAELRELL